MSSQQTKYKAFFFSINLSSHCKIKFKKLLLCSRFKYIQWSPVDHKHYHFNDAYQIILPHKSKFRYGSVNILFKSMVFYLE